MRQEFLDHLDHLLTTEEALVAELRKTQAATHLSDGRSQLLKHLRTLAQSDDLTLMIEVEKNIIQGDLSRYANSTAMVDSLKKALEGMEVIQHHISLVDSKEKYSIINQGYSMAKNRRSGLPFDEARQALASHHARLVNMDKSRLDEADKQLIDARKAVIANAVGCYIQRQAAILEIERASVRTMA